MIFRILALLGLLVLAQAAHAWSNHALITRPALSAMPEMRSLQPVRVESLAAFLAAEPAAIAKLLDDEEAWCQREIPGYPARPAGLAYRPQPGWTDEQRVRAFVAAVRVSPDARLNLFLQLPPGQDAGGWPLLGEAQLTAMKTLELARQNVFVALREGELVSPIEVASTASDEPDYGLDIGLWSDNGTPQGSAYGLGKQPFGNPAIEYTSQGPLHMGFFHESGIVYKAAPYLLRTYPEARIRLYTALARHALRSGHPYWGWRFAGWAMHYVQDLSQPYHANVLPGVGLARMLWVNALDMMGLPGPKADAVTYVTNRHLAVENFELHWLRSATLQGARGDLALAVLADRGSDERDAFADDWPRKRIARRAFEAAQPLDAALVAALPARYVSDAGYTFGVTEPQPDLYADTATTARARATLKAAVAPRLADAGRYSRAIARSVLMP